MSPVGSSRWECKCSTQGDVPCWLDADARAHKRTHGTRARAHTVTSERADETERRTDRERERLRDSETQRLRDSETQRLRERLRERLSETQRLTHTHTHTEREREGGQEREHGLTGTARYLQLS